MTGTADGGHQDRAPSSAQGRARWARRAAVAVAVVGAVTVLVQALDAPADPFLTPAGGAPHAGEGGNEGGNGCDGPADPPRRPLEGFDAVSFRVTAPGGATFDGCALLADTPEARAQGLMHQEDLRGYDGMVFRFEAETEGTFFMFGTTLPLSIAFVGSGGQVVSTADMDPCPSAEPSACPSYAPSGPYLHAVEVLRGDLAAIGMVPGGTVTFGLPAAPS